MGVELRKWEKYVRLGGMTRVKRFIHRLVETGVPCRSQCWMLCCLDALVEVFDRQG